MLGVKQLCKSAVYRQGTEFIRFLLKTCETLALAFQGLLLTKRNFLEKIVLIYVCIWMLVVVTNAQI